MAAAFREDKSAGPGGAPKGADTPGKGGAGAGTVAAPVGPGTMKYKPKQLLPDGEGVWVWGGGGGCEGKGSREGPAACCLCAYVWPGLHALCHASSSDQVVAAGCSHVILKPDAVSA